jgi:hypothetical protein
LDSLPVADGSAALRGLLVLGADTFPARRVDFLAVDVAGAASCAEATGAQHVTSANDRARPIVERFITISVGFTSTRR